MAAYDSRFFNKQRELAKSGDQSAIVEFDGQGDGKKRASSVQETEGSESYGEEHKEQSAVLASAGSLGLSG